MAQYTKSILITSAMRPFANYAADPQHVKNDGRKNLRESIEYLADNDTHCGVMIYMDKFLDPAKAVKNFDKMAFFHHDDRTDPAWIDEKSQILQRKRNGLLTQ